VADIPSENIQLFFLFLSCDVPLCFDAFVILSSDIQGCEGGATYIVQLCCRKNVKKGRKCKWRL